jgi:hypothetical protein
MGATAASTSPAHPQAQPPLRTNTTRSLRMHKPDMHSGHTADLNATNMQQPQLNYAIKRPTAQANPAALHLPAPPQARQLLHAKCCIRLTLYCAHNTPQRPAARIRCAMPFCACMSCAEP